jgi:hypothetical protein
MSAYPNRKKDHDPLDAASGGALPQEMLSLLEELSKTRTFFFEPTPRDADDDRPARPTQSVSVDPPVMVSDSMIALRVSSGYRGAHREATHPTEAGLDLGDYSAEADYMVSFHYPTFGNRFFMVTQTYNRHDVSERVVSLIVRASLEKRRALEAQDRQLRDAAKEAGGPIPKKQLFFKLAFAKDQASDDAYLDEILGAAKKITATFQAIAPDDRSGDGVRIERTLAINLATAEGRDAGLKIGKLWKKKHREQAPMTHADAVKELGAELHSQGLLREDEASQYDRSKMTVTAATSAPAATIAIDTLKEVFTYPVSEGKPTPHYFYKAVADRLTKIALQEDIEVADIDPVEAEACLDASI